jgi:hypothetical protein
VYGFFIGVVICVAEKQLNDGMASHEIAGQGLRLQ